MKRIALRLLLADLSPPLEGLKSTRSCRRPRSEPVTEAD
jgi:hypothetical protein